MDLSCNELTEIQLPDSLPATLQELDLTGNNSLMLEHKTLNLFRYINPDQALMLWLQKNNRFTRRQYTANVMPFVPYGAFTMCLVAVFSNIATLKLDQKSAATAADVLSASTPWNHGYSEMSGQRNK